MLLREDFTPVIMDLGSVEPARLTITTHSQAQYLQDLAAERCSMPYRSPELFQVDSKCTIDERTDIWVSYFQTISRARQIISHHSWICIKMYSVNLLNMETPIRCF